MPRIPILLQSRSKYLSRAAALLKHSYTILTSLLPTRELSYQKDWHSSKQPRAKPWSWTNSLICLWPRGRKSKQSVLNLQQKKANPLWKERKKMTKTLLQGNLQTSRTEELATRRRKSGQSTCKRSSRSLQRRRAAARALWREWEILKSRKIWRTKRTLRQPTQSLLLRSSEEVSHPCLKRCSRQPMSFKMLLRLPRSLVQRLFWDLATRQSFKLRANRRQRSHQSVIFWTSTQTWSIMDNLFAEKF